MSNESQREQSSPSWGDTVMPEAGAERQAKLQRLQGSVGEPNVDPTPEPSMAAEALPLLAVNGQPVTPDPGEAPPYTTPLPQTDTIAGNWAPLEGPGNEAMQDGLSPAPRGFTGGAMGRTVAGLSPSFPVAASGAPPELNEQSQPTRNASEGLEHESPQPMPRDDHSGNPT